PGESAQAAWVRSDLRADLHRLKDLSEDLTDTMVLCASEMFANGVDHSRSGQAGGRVIRTLTMPTAHTVHLALVDDGVRTDVPTVPQIPQRYVHEWLVSTRMRVLLNIDTLAPMDCTPTKVDCNYA